MKIDGTEGIFKLPDSEKTTDRLKDQDRGFQKIFQQTLKPDPSPAVAPSATTFVHPSAPVAKTDAITPDVANAVDRIGQFIDLLDGYRRHLSEPGINLKTLDAMVKKLDGQRESLVPMVNEMPEGDALKTILNESLITASVEIFKFHRGDYLAA